MLPVQTQKEYKDYFKSTLNFSQKERLPLFEYMSTIFVQLDQLTAAISEETFWNVFPKILGIDAKLNLMTELILFEDFSNEEIIKMIETDYRNYFKELCGYDLKTKTKPSMIFTIV